MRPFANQSDSNKGGNRTGSRYRRELAHVQQRLQNEKRRERHAAYEAQAIEHERLEAEHEQKFGALRDRLEELGIDPYLLTEYLATMTQ